MKPDMITRMAPTWQGENWQKALSGAIRDPQELLQLLDLPISLLPAARRAAQLFPLCVTRSYLSRIEPANPRDPLLLQVLPLLAEQAETEPGYSRDPVGDLAANPLPGLIHKYHGRVLLISTGACAIHCRYCFRRHFPYSEDSSSPGQMRQIIDYIQADTSIEEVILSGGDPLSLSNSRLRALGEQLCTIPHLRRLRIHTRMPIVLPERIDKGLLAWLQSIPVQAIMVLHCNHEREIDQNVRQATHRLAGTGLTLLNQAVLLRDINDSVAALKALSEGLFESGILPYYLHQLDKVTGARHFEVPDADAMSLIKQLSKQLPGYLVPRLVRETAGAGAKGLL